MVNKETDELTSYPTTFLDTAGTQTKLALKVARRYGCVLESVLPMSGRLVTMRPATFYNQAAPLRISTFHNLGTDPENWKRWLANQGPVLTGLNVDDTWMNATATGGRLTRYRPNTRRGGHAVCFGGCSRSGLIVRNSWGRTWGDQRFAYASNRYAEQAFTEAYGAVL
jgi:hypothetical protein